MIRGRRIRRRDGKWFYHPWTHGVMPDHPTGYTGDATYIDKSTWVMWLSYPLQWRPYPGGHTPRSRWRVVALWHALLGHTEARP